MERQWVFGGIERESRRRFLVPVPDRSEKTLLALIVKWIEKDIIIISDCWKAYNKIRYKLNKSIKQQLKNVNYLQQKWIHTPDCEPFHYF